MKQTLLTRNELYKSLIELDDDTIIQILFKVSSKYKYPIFRSNSAYPINLNIWGIRSNDERTEYFNDVILTFYDNPLGQWHIDIYEATTDPSNLNLMNPINEKGCAILLTGYHKGLWKLGKHKGRYDALVQARPCEIYRDDNEDDYINFHDDMKVETGMFGINLHRASINQKSDEIGLYSAGCQVLKNTNEFNDLMNLCKKVLKPNGTQSYVLIHEDCLDY